MIYTFFFPYNVLKQSEGHLMSLENIKFNNINNVHVPPSVPWNQLCSVPLPGTYANEWLFSAACPARIGRTAIKIPSNVSWRNSIESRRLQQSSLSSLKWLEDAIDKTVINLTFYLRIIASTCYLNLWWHNGKQKLQLTFSWFLELIKKFWHHRRTAEW